MADEKDGFLAEKWRDVGLPLEREHAIGITAEIFHAEHLHLLDRGRHGQRCYRDDQIAEQLMHQSFPPGVQEDDQVIVRTGIRPHVADGKPLRIAAVEEGLRAHRLPNAVFHCRGELRADPAANGFLVSSQWMKPDWRGDVDAGRFAQTTQSGFN